MTLVHDPQCGFILTKTDLAKDRCAQDSGCLGSGCGCVRAFRLSASRPDHWHVHHRVNRARRRLAGCAKSSPTGGAVDSPENEELPKLAAERYHPEVIFALETFQPKHFSRRGKN